MQKLIKKTILCTFVLVCILLSMSFIYAENATDTYENISTHESIDVNYNLSSATENQNDQETYTGTYSELSSHIRQTESGSILNLTGNYKFSPNDADFTEGIIIYNNLTIVGNNHYIDGSSTARGFIIDSGCNVVLKNLTFKNCYNSENSNNWRKGGAGIYMDENSNLTLYNCIFEDNLVYNTDGGAINAKIGTNVEIYDSIFTNNTSIRESDLEWSQKKCGMGSAICSDIGSTLKLYGSVFKDNVAHMATVLVISYYNDLNYKISTLYIKDCLFENNTVTDCGIIYLDELGQGEIHDSVFKKNKISHYGGIVELDASLSAIVKNCLFEENYATIGGGIHVKVFNDNYFSHVSVADCNFTKNIASKDGGGIFARYGIVKVSNCNFNQNTATRYGGAIYSNFGTMDITNSNFNQNSATSGGGLFFTNQQGSVANSIFTKNAASERAGAIYAIDDKISITNSNFNQNSANRAGALFLKRDDSTIQSSIFNNNKASENGGAIFSGEGSIKIIGSKFNENSAVSGGALHLDTPKITVSSTSFVKNKATEKGGAVYSKNVGVTTSGCSYSGNSAPTGKDVYGVFYATVTQSTKSAGNDKFVVKLTSPWNCPLSQQIKVRISGSQSVSSKWVTTNSKGEATVTVPANVNKAKSNLEVSIKSAACNIKSWTKIKDTAKIKAPKSVKKSAKLNIKVINKATKKPIKKTKFTVKVYTGKKAKTLKVKTDAKGVLKISAKKFSKGKHKIMVMLKNSVYNINSKCSVKIK